MKDEKKSSAVAFLMAAIADYASLTVRVERVMTANGSCYRSKAFAKACFNLGLKHIQTRRYTPKASSGNKRILLGSHSRGSTWGRRSCNRRDS